MNNIPSLTTRFSTPVDSMLIAFYHDSPFDSVSKGVETTLLALSPTNPPGKYYDLICRRYCGGAGGI